MVKKCRFRSRKRRALLESATGTGTMVSGARIRVSGNKTAIEGEHYLFFSWPICAGVCATPTSAARRICVCRRSSTAVEYRLDHVLWYEFISFLTRTFSLQAMIGDRYGARPLPSSIDRDDFADIISCAVCDEDKQLLQQWCFWL